MKILNFKSLGLIIFILFTFCFNLNAQKLRKIFNYLQENQLSLAVEEFNKISPDKKYDEEDKILFSYAKCLFEIDTNFQKYNPNQAVKDFNETYIKSDSKEFIYKFLERYSLSPEVINKKIINEIYREAIKLNTVESLSNALNYYSAEQNENVIKLLEFATYNNIKSSKVISQLKFFLIKYPESIYKHEIQGLLERESLNNYKSINNIDSLNKFISQFSYSNYKNEAIDYRDSLVLTLVPVKYDSLLRYTTEYPNSKFSKKILQQLPQILFKETIEKNDFESFQRFISIYPNDSLRIEIDNRLMDIFLSENSVQKKMNLELEIIDFEGGLAKVVFGRRYKYDSGYKEIDKEGKIGIIDTLNKILVPIIYDGIERMSNGFFMVNFNGKFGIINKNGKILLPLIYDKIREHGILDSEDGTNKFGLAYVSLNELTGCISLNTFKVIIPIKYYHCDFQEHVKLFVVSTAPNTSISQKWGCLDINGKPISPINYCCSIWFREGLAKVCIKNGNGKWGCIDKTGKLVIPFIYDFIDDFSDGYAAFMLQNKYKYGLINRVGKIIIPSIYDRIDYRNGVVIAEKNGKWGLIDITNKELTPFIYDNIDTYELKRVITGVSIVEQNDKYGLLNKTGKEITLIKYDDIEEENGLILAKQNEKWGLLDKTGKEITLIKYDEIREENGLIRVRQNEKWGLLDKNGKEITLIKYDKIKLKNEEDENHATSVKNDGLFIFEENGKYGLINKTGNEITSCKYDELNCLENGLFGAKLSGKFGLIDKNGKELTSFIYDYITKPYNGELLEVFINGKKGVIDKSGKLFRQINFEYIIEFSNGFGRIYKDGKMGIVNRFGEIVIPIIYDEIFLSSGYAIATKNDKSVFIKIDYKASSYNYISS